MQSVSAFTRQTESPPSPAKGQPQPRFGAIGAVALQQLAVDTFGVLCPKLPVAFANRGKIQAAEDIVLELGEDVPFYLTAPIVSDYILGPAMRRVAGIEKADVDKLLGASLEKPWSAEVNALVGTALKELEKDGAKVSNKLLGAKAGTLLGTVAIAAGMEYLVQFAKNVITAKQFHTTNFNAVAGLETNKTQVDGNEPEPVAKAQRRFAQVGSVVAGLLALSFALPFIITRSAGAEKAARSVLKHLDFAKSGNTPFDLTKPILSILILTGVVSYLDASRNDLERKENASRLAFVVPYLLFGKEIAGNLLARFLQNHKVTLNAGSPNEKIVSIAELTKTVNDKKQVKTLFIDESQRFQKSFLNLGIIRDLEAVYAEVKRLPISNAEQLAVLNKFQFIGKGQYLLSALAVGICLTILTYQQTKARFKRKQQAQGQPAPAVPQPFNAQPVQTFHSPRVAPQTALRQATAFRGFTGNASASAF